MPCKRRRQPIFLTQDARSEPLGIAGFEITVLADQSKTEGYEIFQQSGPSGTGPSPHSHPWDESFYVISGTELCGVGEEESLATPGTLVHVPGNTSHWYTFGEQGGEMVSMTSTGNASQMYEDLARSDTDRSKFGAIAGKHGQEYR